MNSWGIPLWKPYPHNCRNAVYFCNAKAEQSESMLKACMAETRVSSVQDLDKIAKGFLKRDILHLEERITL